MREIKFRAWHHLLQQMYADGWHGRCNGEAGTNSTNDHLKFLQKHDIILMQYTGLKDKNGVEIYEGDILRLIDSGWWIEVVTFDTRDASFVTNNFSTSEWRQAQVVGNIYENFELLERAS